MSPEERVAIEICLGRPYCDPASRDPKAHDHECALRDPELLDKVYESMRLARSESEERGRRRGVEERDELRALLRDVQGWVDSRHATEHFDALAETYCKATGNLPPGKSRPMEMGEESEQEREANRERWRAFNQTALAVICARLDAALAPRDSGKDDRIGAYVEKEYRK